MILHVRIEGLEVPVLFDVFNKLAVDIFVGASVVNRYLSGIFSFLRE